MLLNLIHSYIYIDREQILAARGDDKINASIFVFLLDMKIEGIILDKVHESISVPLSLAHGW